MDIPNKEEIEYIINNCYILSVADSKNIAIKSDQTGTYACGMFKKNNVDYYINCVVTFSPESILVKSTIKDKNSVHNCIDTFLIKADDIKVISHIYDSPNSIERNINHYNRHRTL